MKKILLSKIETFSKSPREITELLWTLNVEEQKRIPCEVKVPSSELTIVNVEKLKKVDYRAQPPLSKPTALSESCGVQLPTSELSALSAKKQKEFIHKVQQPTSELSSLCLKNQKEVIHKAQEPTSELSAKKQKEVIHNVQEPTSELSAKKQKEVIYKVQQPTLELSVQKQKKVNYPEVQLPISELSALSVKNLKELKSKVQPPIPLQPPLPLQSPPSDSSLTENLLKKEIENDEYQNGTKEKSSGCIIESEESTYELKLEPSIVITTPPMCRRFVRGTCTKGEACIFDHNVDPKQLKGIFKFCWDFQNRKCSRQKCKHMHASIFEEQHFYRTGYLPQHVIDHYNSATNVLLPLLTPINEDIPKFSCPPPVLPTNIIPLTNGSMNSMELKPEEDFDKQPLKRKWKNLDSGSPSRDVDTCEPLAKKCKNCDAHEFRLQYNKEKLYEMRYTWLDFEEKMDILNDKRKKLNMVLNTFYGAGLLTDDNIGTLNKFSKFTKI